MGVSFLKTPRKTIKNIIFQIYIYIYIIKILKYFPLKQLFFLKLINGFEILSLFICLVILGLYFFFFFFFYDNGLSYLFI